MSFTNKFEKIFKNLLPAPFTIAILLTFLTFFLALIITEPKNDVNHFIQILQFWEKGLWNAPLLVFAIQMMLMLVLGHVLALSSPIRKIISKITFVSSSFESAKPISLSLLIRSFKNFIISLLFIITFILY